jgi:hypothetical protein
MIKITLRVLIIIMCAYGMGVLTREMYYERLELHGFDAIAAFFGFIPFIAACGLIPVLIAGMILQFLVWIFKSE